MESRVDRCSKNATDKLCECANNNRFLLHNGWQYICGCKGSISWRGYYFDTFMMIKRCESILFCKFYYVNKHLCSEKNFSHFTHWGRVTHICGGILIIIGSYNGLSPSRCQTIIWTNARILLIGPSGTNVSEIVIEIITFSFRKIRLKVSSAKWRPFCLGLNVLKLRYTASCNFLIKRGFIRQPTWLQRILKFRIIWILICHWLSLLLCNPHPKSLSLTHELKFDNYHYQIYSL